MTEPKASDSEYKECFVAFLDILGFKALVKESTANSDRLSKLIKALNEAIVVFPYTREKRDSETGVEQKWTLQVRSFSDSIVLFIPIETNTLAWFLFKIRFLQDRMLELGCCLRGAVTIGPMYWDKSWSCRDTTEPSLSAPPNVDVLYGRGRSQNGLITLGPGLIEAYELENRCAIYPRIIFSERLMGHIRSAPLVRAHPICSADPFYLTLSLLDFIKQDADDVFFFDYLHEIIHRNDVLKIVVTRTSTGQTHRSLKRDCVSYPDWMKRIRAYIVEGQVSNRENVNVKCKYDWFARYFNETRDRFGLTSVDEIAIPREPA